MILFIIIFVLLVALFAYAFFAQRRREKEMAELASQNGWTSLGNDRDSLYQYLPQYLQGLGRNGFSFRNNFNRTTDSFDMAYQANVDGRQVVFFQYQYTEYYFEYDPVSHEERETSETHYFIILNAAISKTMPTILLIHHNFLSKLTSFGEHTGLQSITLEGDFNKYFDSYITPDSQIEALSLLTPDTMELVINVANGASMQVLGQSITLSFENKVLTPKIIGPVLDNMTKLVSNILGKAQSELQPDTTPPQVAIPASSDTTSPVPVPIPLQEPTEAAQTQPPAKPPTMI